MNDFAVVVGLALFPALGNFFGGLLADLVPISKRVLNRALHAAAGVVIAIVAVELMPRALQATSGWPVALAFGLGGVAYVALAAMVDRLQGNGSGQGSGTWMVYLAVAVDLFGDGLMIGAGAAVTTSLALVLALGQVLADVPEGFAGPAGHQRSRTSAPTSMASSNPAPRIVGAPRAVKAAIRSRPRPSAATERSPADTGGRGRRRDAGASMANWPPTAL